MGRLNMDETVATAALDRWVRSFALLVADNKDLLTDLDAAIGDGDHGANMDRGMRAVLVALDDTPPVTASALFTKVGMTLVSTVGGASGAASSISGETNSTIFSACPIASPMRSFRPAP